MAAAVSLTFPDGSVKAFDAGATGRDVAESISKSLAKKAVAVAIDGQLRDLADPVTDGAIEIVTRDDQRARCDRTVPHANTRSHLLPRGGGC